jgi:hypothetical protein
MGATSTEGTGLGDAKNSGPKNGRGTFVPLTDPRILAAGICQCGEGGGCTVVFPHPLPGSNHVILATPTSDATTIVKAGGAYNEDGDLGQITIIGEANLYYYYAVVSSGLGTLNN